MPGTAVRAAFFGSSVTVLDGPRGTRPRIVVGAPGTMPSLTRRITGGRTVAGAVRVLGAGPKGPVAGGTTLFGPADVGAPGRNAKFGEALSGAASPLDELE